ncbi:hypothetical protein ThvES_00004990 [Thiovulum sp. ES]|jgi:hypothetical protein|nr:hypothetical protein ThvES_00004990 [Thiovulum sp. ES]
MKKFLGISILLALSTLFSGCYFHVGWGSPVIINNQAQQPVSVDSGYRQ